MYKETEMTAEIAVPIRFINRLLKAYKSLSKYHSSDAETKGYESQKELVDDTL